MDQEIKPDKERDNSLKNVTFVINQSINILEEKMRDEKRHLISTESIQDMSLRHLDLSAETDDGSYCAMFGFKQLICQRLYDRHYRSVREGHYVNLDRCEDLDYLFALAENADIAAEEKAGVSQKIEYIKKTRGTGQMRFDLTTGELIDPLTEDEFMAKIMADSV